MTQDRSELERLRVQLLKANWRYERLTPAEQEALISTTKYAERPHPIDYGLSRHDVCIHHGRYPLDDGLKYRGGEKGHEWRWIFLVAFVVWGCASGGLLYLHASDQVHWTSSETWRIIAVTAPVSLICSIVCLGPIIAGSLDAYRRRRSRPGYTRYNEALELHELYQTTAQAAVHEANEAMMRQKRSYWVLLDGYAFERATAEVLKKHQFDARVTPGSADGGVDIEVTRNGLRGVVQCKAHVAPVGPYVVRDLYGVIHHSRASFGIIVSTGGFTAGAVEFARDKPILFLDISDLIAMQEGKDVLAEAFAPSGKV